MHAPSHQQSAEGAVPILTDRWEHFPHVADMGVRGYGDNLEEAFASAATAMTAVIAAPSGVRPLERFQLRCSAPDREILLYDFLNAIVFEMAVGGRLFSRFRVRIDGGNLSADAWGEPISRERHQPTVEIKGATFTELSVRQAEDGRWIAQCVLDI
jgi:SHS2 domain-containing protein